MRKTTGGPMMVRYALALLAAPVMLAAMPAQIAHAQQKADDLKQVSAYIRAVKTMKADFTQTDRNGRTLSGKLTMKRSEERREGKERERKGRSRGSPDP